jgi:predicted DNA-binding protein (UPF0251 family)
MADIQLEREKATLQMDIERQKAASQMEMDRYTTQENIKLQGQKAAADKKSKING